MNSLKTLAQNFIGNKINTYDFVNIYIDTWKSNDSNLDGMDELSASSIYFSCDLFNNNPCTREPYEIDEKELRIRIKMALDGESDKILERVKAQQNL